MVVEVVQAGGEGEKPTEAKEKPWTAPPPIDGLSPLERHIMEEIHERENGTYVDRSGAVGDLQQWLRKKGMKQTRLDRWTWSEQPQVGDFYLEIGTVLGEVRVRWYNLPDQAATGAIDIRTEKHLTNGKKRLAGILKLSQGLRYERGRGWVKP